MRGSCNRSEKIYLEPIKKVDKTANSNFNKVSSTEFDTNSDLRYQTTDSVVPKTSDSESYRATFKLYSQKKQTSANYRPSKNNFIKFCPRLESNPSEMDSKDTYKEMSLDEIGFDNIEIPDWDKIVQPQKPDLLHLLEQMIKNYEKPNVQIRIENAIFNCHLMVLQCYSDFFMELNNEQIVILPADRVSPQAFVMIYDWMLSSDPMVQREGILDLFNAAQYLKIKDLEDQCWICIDDDQRLSEDAAFLLYLEARKLGQESVQNLMLTRIYKFFLTLVASKEFLELTLKEICLLLSSNSIGVTSETEVLMSAVRWLNYDWNEREKYLLDVMKCVRFGLMVPWQLIELKRNSDCEEILRVVKVPEVHEMVDDGLSYITTKYWYADNSENLFHLMERLNLIEPTERQWICDRTMTTDFRCPNEMYNSYKSFLEYLDMIRKMGKDHWRTLELGEGNPNVVLRKYNKNYDINLNNLLGDS